MIKRRYTLLLPILLLHVFNILEQCSRLSCLTIDSRISVVTNDCYARTSIGYKLSNANIVSRVEVGSLTECKEQCSTNGSICNAFTFGVGLDGNRTCGIATRIPTLEDLETHPDYDVYIKKRQGSAWCNDDRLFRDFITRGNESRTIEIERPNDKGLVTKNIGNFLSKPVSTPFRPLSFPSDRNVTVRHGLIGTYDLFVNHDGRFLSGADDRNRVLDILTNRNQGPASRSSFVPICHRKLQSGKKMMDLHVERIVPCENVQDCRWACDYEQIFVCNGYNYGHGTNGSKDTCELTSTPYYRTNANRDFLIDSRYDYYERDRNCLPSMRGDDIVRWTNRDKVYQRNRQPPLALLNREDREFISRSFSGGVYDKETDKEFPRETSRDFASRRYPTEAWSNDRRNSDIVRNVDSRHGPRIDYNEPYSDNFKPSIFSFKSQFGDRSLSHEFFDPRQSEHFYGKFYNYGSAFGYNDDYYAPSTKEIPSFEEHEQSSETNKCSIRLTAGSKLSRNVLRKTCLVRNFKQCEDFCINESNFPCESFAYRYNVLTTNPTDNCLLSDLSYQHFNFYTDLEPDRDYDSYTVSQDSNVCHSKQRTTNRYPSEECFSRVRSGFGIPTDVTKRSMLVNDLGECQYACAMSQEFLCRSFVFKYATEHHDRVQERTTPNCFLTDSTSEEINPVNMLDMDGAELYERNSFSYDCEPYPPLPLPMTGVTVPNGRESSALENTDEICYFQHRRPCKLLPHAIVSSTQAVTKSECCRKCSTMRNIDSTRQHCMSFNYMIIADDTRDNCLLSNIPARDLRPHLDYVYDEEHALYTWKDLDPYCSLTVNPLNSPSTSPPFVSKEHGRSPFSSALFAQSNAQGIVVENGIRSHGPILDSFQRTRSKYNRPENHEHDYEDNRETYYLDAGPRFVSDDFQHEFGGYHYPAKEHSIFQRYTVNGYPCKNGSVCQRNEIAGFWSCEIEENEQGSWDYCCQPNHRCGFSQGYHYPWCYVGSNDEQWRPCSETYYPYYSPKDHRSFHSQLPAAYLARHWPVIYLHGTLPPNCTVGNLDDKQYSNQNHRRSSP